MPVTFVGKGALVSSATSIAPARPAATQVGDLLIAIIQTSDLANLSAFDADWPEVTEIANGGVSGAAGYAMLHILFRYATLTVADDLSIPDLGDHQYGLILAYRGVRVMTASALQFIRATSADGAATTTMTFPGLTTVRADSLIVGIAGLSLDAASTTAASGYTNADLTSITERHDETIALGTGGGVAIFDGYKAVAGTVSATTGTMTSNRAAYVTLALPPASPDLSSPTATSITTTTATPQITLTF